MSDVLLLQQQQQQRQLSSGNPKPHRIHPKRIAAMAQASMLFSDARFDGVPVFDLSMPTATTIPNSSTSPPSVEMREEEEEQSCSANLGENVEDKQQQRSSGSDGKNLSANENCVKPRNCGDKRRRPAGKPRALQADAHHERKDRKLSRRSPAAAYPDGVAEGKGKKEKSPIRGEGKCFRSTPNWKLKLEKKRWIRQQQQRRLTPLARETSGTAAVVDELHKKEKTRKKAAAGKASERIRGRGRQSVDPRSAAVTVCKKRGKGFLCTVLCYYPHNHAGLRACVCKS
jgi:hypothetical protein